MSEKTTEEKVDLKVMFKNLPENLITALQGKLAEVISTEVQMRECNKTYLELNDTSKRLSDLRRKILAGTASMDEFHTYETLKLTFKYLKQKMDQDEQERKDCAGTQQAHIQDFGDCLTEILDDLSQHTHKDWSALFREVMREVKRFQTLDRKLLETLRTLDKVLETYQTRTRKVVRWLAGGIQ